MGQDVWTSVGKESILGGSFSFEKLYEYGIYWLHLLPKIISSSKISEKILVFCCSEKVCWKYQFTAAAATAKSLQPCPTLCDPVPGILQARTLEWVAVSFSNAWKWKVKVKLLSHVWLFLTPWTAAYQAPPSMGFSRQEYWSGVTLPSLISSLKALKSQSLSPAKIMFTNTKGFLLACNGEDSEWYPASICLVEYRQVEQIIALIHHIWNSAPMICSF